MLWKDSGLQQSTLFAHFKKTDSAFGKNIIGSHMSSILPLPASVQSPPGPPPLGWSMK